MAGLTLFVFSLLVSTTLAANEDLQDTQAIECDESPEFEALPQQVGCNKKEFDKKEFYFHLYFHLIFDGPNKPTISAINPNSDFPNFGPIMIYDVPLWDSLYENKLIARAQGASFKSATSIYDWHMSFNIEFEIPKLKGSTLQVMGRGLQLKTPREWAIVGGTGNLTLAQGVVYGRRLSSPNESIWFELKIHGYCTPMDPAWN